MPKKEHLRVEEKWSSLNELYMRNMIKLCKVKSSQHEQAGYSFKQKNTIWGLPIVLVPVIMSPVSLLLESSVPTAKYVNAGAFLVTGLISGVYSFFKFGEKMTNHFNFSARYTDVASDVELELVKGREFRTQLDVFATRIHMIVDNLSNTEPVLPKGIAEDKKYKLEEVTYESIQYADGDSSV